MTNLVNLDNHPLIVGNTYEFTPSDSCPGGFPRGRHTISQHRVGTGLGSAEHEYKFSTIAGDPGWMGYRPDHWSSITLSAVGEGPAAKAAPEPAAGGGGGQLGGKRLRRRRTRRKTRRKKKRRRTKKGGRKSRKKRRRRRRTQRRRKRKHR